MFSCFEYEYFVTVDSRQYECAPRMLCTPKYVLAMKVLIILCSKITACVFKYKGESIFLSSELKHPIVCIEFCLKQALEGDPAPLWTQHNFVLTPLDLGIFK